MQHSTMNEILYGAVFNILPFRVPYKILYLETYTHHNIYHDDANHWLSI
jgi:hypothetical protein